ncbi:hypothetical protein M404DRAFT_146643, partial [Pisolithus tinctorius Marx 270]
PCLWQAKAAQAFLQGNKDIVCIAGTSMGKTLTFWMPLLFDLKAIQIIVTPLNQLGKQQVENLESMGLWAIAINADTANEKIYEVYTFWNIPLLCTEHLHLTRMLRH